MRRLLLVAATIVVRAASARSQAAPLVADSLDAITRSQLESARDVIWHAWFSSDSAALSQILPKAVAAGSRNGWQNRETTLAAARRFVDGHGRLIEAHFDSTDIRVRGAVAVVQSRYTLTLEQDGKRSTRTGIATEVFVKERGRWTNPFWYLE